MHAGEQLDEIFDLQFFEHAAQLCAAAMRGNPCSGSQPAKPQPGQLFAQYVPGAPLFFRQGIDQNVPGVVPIGERGFENPPLSAFQQSTAAAGERILAATPEFFGLDPALASHARERGTHRAFADAQHSHQLHDAAGPDFASQVQNVVSEEGEEQKLGADGKVLGNPDIGHAASSWSRGLRV